MGYTGFEPVTSALSRQRSKPTELIALIPLRRYSQILTPVPDYLLKTNQGIGFAQSLENVLIYKCIFKQIQKMKKFYLLLCLFTGLWGFGQGTAGIVDGTVSDSLGNRIPNYAVLVMDSSSSEGRNTLQKIALYPNPSKGESLLELERESQVVIYSLEGKIIHEWTSKGGEEHLPELRPGTYFIRIKDQCSAQVLRWIISH